MTFDRFPSIPIRAPGRLFKPLLILLLTAGGFAVMGYHPGLEDDGIYLSAVKADLNPALYPHDADFFRLQSQATVFDGFIAGFVRLTRIPVPLTELLGQLLSLYTILWAAHSIAQRLFVERRAQWAGVALLSAMFTLPVAGTALNLADQHLHPRNVATALILVAITRVMAGNQWQAMGLLALATLVHPIMAGFGISFVVCLGLASRGLRAGAARDAVLATVPLSWIFEQPTPEWRRALGTRTYYFLYQWTWYEWLGAIGPLVIFWFLWRCAEGRPAAAKDSAQGERADYRSSAGAKALTHFAAVTARLKSCPVTKRVSQGDSLPGRFALALLVYGTFQLGLAIFLLAPAALVRITPLQPMRYLHLQYVFLVLIAGGLVGRYVLGRIAWRWAVFLVAVNGGMFITQRMLLPSSQHLELPGRAPESPWLQAFAWIRENTPADAYFALDPAYLSSPGEDYHSFRALAERSQLADAIKDAAVVTQVPELGRRWVEQVDAQAGWRGFQGADFERLQARFGVEWFVVAYPPPARLTCIWHHGQLSVCRLEAGSRTSVNH